MKTYVKPTVDVVELSVKENIAVLPAGINYTTGTYTPTAGGQAYAETVYDLTTASNSVLGKA